MQHLVHGDEIRGGVVEGQSPDICMPHGTMVQPCLFQIQTRDIQHGVVDIHTDPTRDPVGEELEHATGSNAYIDHQIERPFTSQLPHGPLDFMVGQMQCADLVPIHRHAFEIGLRRNRARLLDSHQAGHVAPEDRIIIGDKSTHGLRKLPRAAAIREPIEDIGSFRQSFRQTRVGKEFEMPAHARLALAQDLDQF